MASRISAALAVALVSFAPAASAQRVLLQIKPHVGDTIKMHLTQTIEMSGTRWSSSRDSTKTLTTTTEVFSRAVPYQWTSGGTLIRTITDSVKMKPQGYAAAQPTVRAGTVPPAPAVMRVASDGAIEVVDDGDPTSELRHLFAEMPSMLPRKAVAVGEKWSKEMRIPLSGDPGSEGTVKATLQLDSLSRSGEVAFISIRGTIARFTDAEKRASGSAYRTSGTFIGSMQIDRALGWITDSRSVVTLHSEIADDKGPASRGSGKPLQVNTKVSVWTRAVKQR